MKSLDDRINNLIATAQSWQVIKYSKSGKGNFDITSEYNIKLNSNSSVCLIEAKCKMGDTYVKSLVPIKGDFSITIASNTSQKWYWKVKRVGNSIFIENDDRHGDGVQSGTIVILN